MRAFTDFLSRCVPGSVSFFTDVGGSTSSLNGSLGALRRLGGSLRVVWSAGNRWVVVDYPNFPASVPRRLPVYLVARIYLSALRLTCALRGARLVLQSDDDPAMQDEWLGLTVSERQMKLERAFERRLYRYADLIWFSGLTSAEIVCARFDLPMSKAVHVPNGAAPPLTVRPGPERAVGGSFRFAYTGTLAPGTHGVAGLISEFRRVADPGARLVLAGPDGEWIPGYLSEHPDDRVVYLGCLHADRVQSLLQSCDAGILTGQRGGYHDTGFPGKLGAYFAAGLPVIATVLGDTAMLIAEHHVGIVCEEHELGETMARLLADVPEYSLYRRNALARKDDYLWDRIYLRALESLEMASGMSAYRGGAALGRAE